MRFLAIRGAVPWSCWRAGVLLFFACWARCRPSTPPASASSIPKPRARRWPLLALTVVVFLLLMVLLMLLLRNILKLYADQSSSALGARLRTRMVLGAALIALTPAVFMFLFSFQLMNRSIDRWFSPNTSELREDSTRVVLELAQYVTSNARGRGGVDCGIRRAGPGSAGSFRMCWARTASRWMAALPWSTTRIGTCWPAFRRRRRPARPACCPGWTKASTGAPVPLHGPLSAHPARRGAAQR